MWGKYGPQLSLFTCNYDDMTKKPTNPTPPTPSHLEGVALIKAIAKNLGQWDKRNITELSFMLAELGEACKALGLSPDQFITKDSVPTLTLPPEHPEHLWAVDAAGNSLTKNPGEWSFKIVGVGESLGTPDTYDFYFREPRPNQLIVRVGDVLADKIDKAWRKSKFKTRNDWFVDLILRGILKQDR